MFNVSQIMEMLSRARPVFYSEADFQHAFAWQVHLQNPNYIIQLEYPISPGQEADEYLDVLVSDSKNKVAVELKYKTSTLLAPIGGDIFLLKSHGAQDQGRYDFLKDVQRLEKYLSDNPNSIGYAIFLSNDSSYWKPGRNEKTVCDDFRLTEGRNISATLNWGESAGKGTIRKRESPIILKNTYECVWREYSNIERHEYVKGSTQFKYLVLDVARTQANLS